MLILGILLIIAGIALNAFGLFGVSEILVIIGVLFVIIWFFRGHGKKILNKLLSGQDLNSTLRESAVEKIATHVDADNNSLVGSFLKAQKKFFWRCQRCGEETITMGATQVTAFPRGKSRCFGNTTHSWICYDHEELHTDLQFKNTTKASTSSNAFSRYSDAQLVQMFSRADPAKRKYFVPELMNRGYLKRDASNRIVSTGKKPPRV